MAGNGGSGDGDSGDGDSGNGEKGDNGNHGEEQPKNGQNDGTTEPPEADESDDNDKCSVELSSPALGVGWNGSVAGDKIPILYTWADEFCEKHTTDYFPAEGEYFSAVIVTPAQIAGEPIQTNNYKTSAKYLRLMQWKANHGITS